jgi:predicted MPP superfamily phosphohydrolase
MHNEIFTTNKNINETKIALLSDIHYHSNYNKKIFDKIIKQIKNNKPNYITIVGDILDSSNTTKLDKLKYFLEEISKISPVIVVIGNHDEKKGEMHKWKFEPSKRLITLLNSIPNIHLLRDETYTINNITFYGVDFSYKYYEKDYETYESFCNEIKEKKCNIPKNTYNITLIHSPINIYNFIKKNPKHKLNNSDLILSGHMHNGCLPFWISHLLNKTFKTSRIIISPTRKIFPKYAQGRIYERDGYVYEGLVTFSNSTKLFNKLDIFFHKQVAFITIKKEQ